MLEVFVSRVEDQFRNSQLDGRWKTALTRCRQDQIDRFQKPADRQRAWAGEFFLRTLLHERCALPYGEIRISRNRSGKPFLEGTDVEFNLSHSGNRIVAALGVKPVGIDVERLRPVPEMESIAHRFFSASERDWVLSATRQDRSRRFFEIWTLKESYIKAVGRGLEIDLASFSLIKPDRCGSEELRFLLKKHFKNRSGSDYHFRLFSDDSEYPISVCSESASIPQGIEWR